MSDKDARASFSYRQLLHLWLLITYCKKILTVFFREAHLLLMRTTQHDHAAEKVTRAKSLLRLKKTGVMKRMKLSTQVNNPRAKTAIAIKNESLLHAVTATLF